MEPINADRSSSVIALDIGGSKINAARLDECGEIGARESYSGPLAEYWPAVREAALLVKSLARNGPLELEPAIGVSLAGMLSADRSTLRQSIFPDWRGRAVATDLSGEFGVPVVVENDGNCAAWGEFSRGAGTGTSTFVLLTLGTGVGGGIVIDGKIHKGAHGIAAELGHISVSDDGAKCGCGGIGCLEIYGSGRRLVRDYAIHANLQEPASQDTSQDFRPLSSNHRRKIEKVFQEDLTRGKDEALGLIADIGRRVGYAVDILVRSLDPDVIAIGGGLSALGRPLLSAIERGAEAAQSHSRVSRETKLALAELGNDAGLVGAAHLARARVP